MHKDFGNLGRDLDFRKSCIRHKRSHTGGVRASKSPTTERTATITKTASRQAIQMQVPSITVATANADLLLSCGNDKCGTPAEHLAKPSLWVSRVLKMYS